MWKGIFAAIILMCTNAIHSVNIRHVEDCKQDNRDRHEHSKCIVTPTHTPTPTPTRRPTPTPTFTPTPTPKPRIIITDVDVKGCSKGSSCYEWLTNIRVKGKGFAEDSQIKLSENIQGNPEFTGQMVGGNGTTDIATDFKFLPHCAHFTVIVSGSTGTATAPHPIVSACP